MKRASIKIGVMSLVIGLFVVSCGGSGSSKTSGTSQSTVQGGTKQIITEDKATDVESMARLYYFAASMHEEFTFDKSGALTKYLKVYTFLDGANKQQGLENAIANGISAANVKIEGNTLVINNETYLAIYAISDVKYDKVKETLDNDGTKYTVK